MSKYNQSVLTDAGLALAKKANAGEAKFKITRVATSSTNLSDKSVEELQKVAELPNIMQYGKILDADDVETDNVALGISCRFTNEGLKNGYDVQTVGLFAQEEGTDHDFLFALATAVAPEHMPDFGDLVLYRFSLNFYVVVGRTSAVTVWVDDKTVVSVKKFEDHIKEANSKIEALKKQLEDGLKQAGKVETVSVDGGVKIQPVDKNIDLPLNLKDYATKQDLTDNNSQFNQDLQGKLDQKANISDVYGKNDVYSKNEVYNKTETYNKAEIDAKDRKNIKTIEGNGPDNNGEAKLPNFKFATAINPTTKQVTTNTATYNTYVLVTPESLNALIEKVNQLEADNKYFKEHYVETRAFSKSEEAQAEAWENEKPHLHLAFITDK